jgi:hypothetical protein
MCLVYLDPDGTNPASQKENVLNAWRLVVGVFAVTLVLAAIGASWAVTRQQSESVSVTPPENTTTISERTTASNTKPAMSLPAEDVPGKDVPDLPRYPRSVRVEYERKEQDRLVFTTVRYLSRAKVDVIRGFYRGVFRSKNWTVANAEFSEGEWTFLVVHGDREAQVRIEPHRRGVTRVDIVLSESLPEKKPSPKQIPQKREASPATQQPASLPSSQSATPTPAPAPQSASPAPQSATPAPAPQPAAPAPQPAPTPDDYEEGGDDLGDDGGGDD